MTASEIERSRVADPLSLEREEARVASLVALLAEAQAQIGRVFLGQDHVVERLLIALMSNGHVLLEGPPGVGKTLLVRVLSAVTGLSFSRVQFTPDLMPADITGSMALSQDGDGTPRLQFQAGPVFTQLLLADEINRATPRTQSALLEAMQERTVSVAGRTMALPRPFFVMATQNPFEMEGTYTLPEAQIDRFLMQIDVDYPDVRVLADVLDLTTGDDQLPPPRLMTAADILDMQAFVKAVPVARHVRDTVAHFAVSTQPGSPHATDEVRRYVRFGLSPRGAQALVAAAKAHALLNGKFNVGFENLKAVLLPAIRHRIQLNFDGQEKGLSFPALIEALFERSRTHVR